MGLPSTTAHRIRPTAKVTTDRRSRQSRRLARHFDDSSAGPSGWRHDGDGDERDLIPPSDVEEYEEWRTRKERRSGRRARSLSADTDDPLLLGPSRRSSYLYGSQSSSSSPSALHAPSSPANRDNSSQTIVPTETAETMSLLRAQCDADVSMREGDCGQSKAWPNFFSSPVTSPSVSLRTAATSSPVRVVDDDGGNPSRLGQQDIAISDALTLAEDRVLANSLVLEASAEEGMRQPSLDITEVPQAGVQKLAHEPQTPPRDVLLKLDSPVPEDASASFTLLHASFSYPPGSAHSARSSRSPLVEAQIGTHNRPQWRSPSSTTPTASRTGKSHRIEDRLPMVKSAGAVSVYADLEARDTSFEDDFLDHPATASPSTPLIGQEGFSSRPRVEQQTRTLCLDASSLASARNRNSANLSRSPPVAVPPDPALERFRNGRTFRTRTKLQLQPYTKERQIYEAALRRGGLKNGKTAVAQSREISSSEDQQPEGGDDDSSEAEEDPERIVIGNTQSAEHPPRVRKVLPLSDADYDRYFLDFGMPADLEDAVCVDKLQMIARKRVREQRLERKRLKAEAKRKKEYRLFLRGDLDPDSADRLSGSESLMPPIPLSKKPRLENVNAISFKKHLGRKKSISTAAEHANTAILNVSTPRSPHFLRYSPSLMPDGEEFLNEYDTPMVYEGHSALQQSPEYLAHPPSVEDPPPPADDAAYDFSLASRVRPGRTSISGSSTSESGSESDASRAIRDPREKIARRMMPAAMLRRLEQEAAAKAQQRLERQRKDERMVNSPVRPGRAVVRKAYIDVDVNEFVQHIASDDEAEETIDPLITANAVSILQSQQQKELFVVSEGDSSDGSQALEDNTDAQSLAHLFAGDFESIVTGQKRDARTTKRGLKAGSRVRALQAARPRTRRPVLGLAKQVRTPVAARRTPVDRNLFQSRLEFPAQEKSPLKSPRQTEEAFVRSNLRASNQKRRRDGKERRPAIHLDDHVIFATSDFAFDPNISADRPVLPSRSAPQGPGGTPSTLTQEHLDSGIGKARSWANFDKFPIDFGITPLPSGIHCAVNTFIGRGRVSMLKKTIQTQTDSLVVPSFHVYGVDLGENMSPAQLTPIIPLLFDALGQSVKSYANGLAIESPDLRPLSFLGTLFVKSVRIDDEVWDPSLKQCASAITFLSAEISELHSSTTRWSRGIHGGLSRVQLELLDLACRLTSVSPEIRETPLISGCATNAFRQLLAAGFDKAIKPLKDLLCGGSEDAQIDQELTTTWIAVIKILEAVEAHRGTSILLGSLTLAVDRVFHLDRSGPIAAERLWFLVYGLCALQQFDEHGWVSSVFEPVPQWSLVRRAIGLIRITHSEEAEERAHMDQLYGRDRYIKVMIARCLRLSSVWKWGFDRTSFGIASKDLGIIFKDRQYRNLPTESPVDFPAFITRFDMSLTTAEESKKESAFELYLRLVCVAGSDLIGTAQTLLEAQHAERHVQRLVMTIMPVSPVKFNRLLPPTMRQLGQLTNRYSTMIAACYFSPSLLPWLLANSKKWAPFGDADFESRQVSIRGLMYLAAACRHHGQSLEKVVGRLADILAQLQSELDTNGKQATAPRAPSRIEIERTMVLVVVCFKQIILHHSFDPVVQALPVYPDSCLLHESWTSRIFSLDLVEDHRCGMEVVGTIQTFLDVRSAALPLLAKQRREARERKTESQDEYSFGIDFSAVDLAALGGEVNKEDPHQLQDVQFAKIINEVISPKIYRLLSDLLSMEERIMPDDQKAERRLFISKLTKCWSDCAGVIVIELNSPDGWEPYIGLFGKESWQRLREEEGRLQVGLRFMLNVAKLDPNCYPQHEDVFVALLFQSVVTDNVTIEHRYISALFNMSTVLDMPLFAEVALLPGITDGFDRTSFMDQRSALLEAIFSAIPTVITSPYTPAATKALVYRAVNLMVSAMMHNEKAIPRVKFIHAQSYRAFALRTASNLVRLAGEVVNPTVVPGLRQFLT